MPTLGYDDTMKRVAIDGEEQFRIEFKGRDAENKSITERYITKRVISNIAADRIAGHATRVWEVAKIDPATGEPADETKVLKDSWVERSRMVEGERYRQINKWLQDDPERDYFKDYFLTFYADSELERNGKVESTFGTLRGELPPTGDAKGNETGNKNEKKRPYAFAFGFLSNKVGPSHEIIRHTKRCLRSRS